MQSNNTSSIAGSSILDLIAPPTPRARPMESESPFGSLLEARPAPQPTGGDQPQPVPRERERQRQSAANDAADSPPARTRERGSTTDKSQPARPADSQPAAAAPEDRAPSGDAESIPEDAGESTGTETAGAAAELAAALAVMQVSTAAAPVIDAVVPTGEETAIAQEGEAESGPSGMATAAIEELPPVPGELVTSTEETASGNEAVAGDATASALPEVPHSPEETPAASPAAAVVDEVRRVGTEKQADSTAESPAFETADGSNEATPDVSAAGEQPAADDRQSEAGPQDSSVESLPQPTVALEPASPAQPQPTESVSTTAETTNHLQASITPQVDSPGNRHRLPAAILGAANGDSNRPAADLNVDSVRLLQRVARAFAAAHERGGEVRLRLTPPELGTVRLEVQMQDGAMVARVEAETATARTAIIENLPALRERLAEQGVRIERFEVDLMNQHNGGPPDQRPSDDRQPAAERRPASAAPAERELPSVVPRSVAASLEPGRLNVIV